MNPKLNLNQNANLNTNQEKNKTSNNHLKLIPVGIPIEDYATAKKRNAKYFKA